MWSTWNVYRGICASDVDSGRTVSAPCTATPAAPAEPPPTLEGRADDILRDNLIEPIVCMMTANILVLTHEELRPSGSISSIAKRTAWILLTAPIALCESYIAKQRLLSRQLLRMTSTSWSMKTFWRKESMKFRVRTVSVVTFSSLSLALVLLSTCISVWVSGAVNHVDHYEDILWNASANMVWKVGAEA